MRPQINCHCLSAIPATEKRRPATMWCQFCPFKQNQKEQWYQCLRPYESPALCIDLYFQHFPVSIGIALEHSDNSDSYDESHTERNKSKQYGQ